MKEVICNYCGEAKRIRTGVSVVTGEVFEETCPKCGGKGRVPADTPETQSLSDSERRKLGEKLVRENIQHGRDAGIMSKLRQVFPEIFRR